MKANLRRLALELLDDDHGITQEAWEVLYSLLEKSGEKYEDIVKTIESSDGRVYLPEDHNLYRPTFDRSRNASK
jgi:hypothetical protein